MISRVYFLSYKQQVTLYWTKRKLNYKKVTEFSYKSQNTLTIFNKNRKIHLLKLILEITKVTKDTIYASLQQVEDFTFDAPVVEVFPDMIKRSVPGYSTIVSTMGKLAGLHAQDNSNLYDLGS